MSTFTSTRVFLTDEPDEDMVQTKLEVLELTPADWALICEALDSMPFWHRRDARNLLKDIRSEILTHLPEEAE